MKPSWNEVLDARRERMALRTELERLEAEGAPESDKRVTFSKWQNAISYERSLEERITGTMR